VCFLNIHNLFTYCQVEEINELSKTLTNQSTTNNAVSADSSNIAISFTKSPTNCIVLNQIISENNKLSLAEPIIATSVFQDGLYIMENIDLGIVATASDIGECFREFNEEVFFIWKEYGEEDEAKLTNDAKELKRRILSYVKP